MSSAAAGTPKWPGDHAEKHRQAALLGWARKRGFTRDTVKRGRRKPSEPAAPKAPPSRGMELARQVQVSAQRTRPAAHPDYSPHAGNVARLTLMHELGMEQDAAKRAKIRRELRKLGVPSDQIPKEPRKPAAPRAERSARDAENIRLLRESIADAPDRIRRARAAGNEADARFWENGLREDRTKLKRYEARQARERSAAVSQPKTARKPAAGTRQNTPGLVPVKHVEGHVMSFSGLLDPYYLHELYGPAQFHRALDGYSATRLREAVQVVQERNPGTHPRGHSKPALIAYIMAHVGGGGGAERSAAVSQPKPNAARKPADTSGDHLARLKKREAEDMAAMRALFAEFQAGVGPDAEYYENRHALYTVSPKMHRMIRKLRGLRTQIRKAGGTPASWPSEYGRES